MRSYLVVKKRITDYVDQMPDLAFESCVFFGSWISSQNNHHTVHAYRQPDGSPAFLYSDLYKICRASYGNFANVIRKLIESGKLDPSRHMAKVSDSSRLRSSIKTRPSFTSKPSRVFVLESGAKLIVENAAPIEGIKHWFDKRLKEWYMSIKSADAKNLVVSHPVPFAKSLMLEKGRGGQTIYVYVEKETEQPYLRLGDVANIFNRTESALSTKVERLQRRGYLNNDQIKYGGSGPFAARYFSFDVVREMIKRSKVATRARLLPWFDEQVQAYQKEPPVTLSYPPKPKKTKRNRSAARRQKQAKITLTRAERRERTEYTQEDIKLFGTSPITREAVHAIVEKDSNQPLFFYRDLSFMTGFSESGVQTSLDNIYDPKVHKRIIASVKTKGQTRFYDRALVGPGIVRDRIVAMRTGGRFVDESKKKLLLLWFDNQLKYWNTVRSKGSENMVNDNPLTRKTSLVRKTIGRAMFGTCPLFKTLGVRMGGGAVDAFVMEDFSPAFKFADLAGMFGSQSHIEENIHQLIDKGFLSESSIVRVYDHQVARDVAVVTLDGMKTIINLPNTSKLLQEWFNQRLDAWWDVVLAPEKRKEFVFPHDSDDSAQESVTEPIAEDAELTQKLLAFREKKEQQHNSDERVEKLERKVAILIEQLAEQGKTIRELERKFDLVVKVLG